MARDRTFCFFLLQGLCTQRPWQWHVVLLEGEARLVEWEDVGIVHFELSEDGSELLVRFAAGINVARVRDTTAGTGWRAERDRLRCQSGVAFQGIDAEQ